MKCTFVCASSCIKHYVQPSYGCRGTPVVARMCVYTARKTTSHTHTFHPLSTIVIHTFNLCKVKSMDDNCGEWVECMGVASGCGEQEVGVANGSGGIYGCGYWVWL